MFLRTIILCVALLGGRAGAQITAELLLEQRQFIPNEMLRVGVRVTNHSGQTLSLGQGDWVRLLIETDDGYVVKTYGTPPFEDPFDLKTSYRATKWVDIAPYFDLSEQGSYLLQGVVRIDQWDQEIACKPVPFEVIQGVNLWEQRFGVPGPDPEAPPEIRKYSIIQANYLDELKLYFQLSNAETGEIRVVYPIANMVQITRPQAELDALNQLHVLARTGKQNFAHIIFDTDGQLKSRQTYRMTDYKPRLKSTASGSIFVSGGLRVISSEDFPPPKPVPPVEIPPSDASEATIPTAEENTPAFEIPKSDP